MKTKNTDFIPLADCVRIAGSPNAGLFLFRLQAWLKHAKVVRDGKLWVAHTREWWETETGLSTWQVRSSLEQLLKKGLIARRIMRFDRQPMMHLAMLVEPPTQVGGIHPGQDGCQHPTQDGCPHPTHKQQNKQQDLQQSYPSDSATTPEAQMDKETQKAIGAGAKAKDIVSLIKKPELDPAEMAKGTPKLADLGLMWRQQMQKAFPDYHVMEFGQKQNGQLGHLRTKLGQDCPLILARAIWEWSDFASYVRVIYAYKNPPAKPDVGFLLFQAEALMNWYLLAINPVDETKSMQMISPTSAPAAPAVVKSVEVGTTPTEEDLAAIEAMING